MGVLESIKSYDLQGRHLAWEGTFSQYLELVFENPSIARSAHSRIYDMISSCGWKDTPEGRQYHFFSGELFGIEATLQILVEDYLRPSAYELDTKKRVLLLMGPVGTGKSTIVDMIKRGLEEYSKTPEGALYGIKGCPMHEEPLHLIPRNLRGELEALGVRVEGSLCPRCRVMLEEDYGGVVRDVPVERVFLSEEKRVGIGTFVPSDPKSQDISELTGSLDFSTIGKYGAESDPRAYRFDGELNKANRGVMEFQELLKCDEKFLYNLLSLTQEGNFKVGRFALISADEVVIGHTNRVEYEEFIRDRRNEALNSRIFVIPVPYNLRVTQEERIYRKLLDRSRLCGRHFEPYALRAAAMFSIMTRLREPQKQGVSLVKKMYMYDGKLPAGSSPADVKELRWECPGEGMNGIDPRFVLNCISSALVSRENGCVTGLDILHNLNEALKRHPSISPGDRDRLARIFLQAQKEYNSLLLRDIISACMGCFSLEAEEVFKNYVEGVSFHACREQGCREEGGQTASSSGEEIKSELLDRIEEEIGVSGSGKRFFREEILARQRKYAALGRKFDFKAHPGLKKAVEMEAARQVLRREVPPCMETGETSVGKLLTQILVKEHGYCCECAEAAQKHARDLLGV